MNLNERTFRASEAHKLEDPERLKWLPPAEIIGRLELKPGATVADVGAGTGFFAIPLAELLGPAGAVYAVDLQDEMLDILAEKLSRRTPSLHLVLKRGEALRTGLPNRSCDLVFMANLWHELDDHKAVLRESSRILRPQGRLAIVDWRHDCPPPPGPPAEHRLVMNNVVTLLQQSGWKVQHSGPVAAYSYMIISTFVM
jgi:ubiquinone/menaquinone biosynthesis C-methylase UbiE